MDILKNKKGFTLVELLAVLVILGLIAVICYPIVTKTINSQKSKLSTEQKNRIITAAKNYVASNTIDDNTCLSVSQLQGSGYLEIGDVKDPNGGSLNGAGVQISWNEDNHQYVYQFVSSC